MKQNRRIGVRTCAVEFQETPDYRGLNPITHPYQPINSVFTGQKPLSPDKNRFSPSFSDHIEHKARKKG
jgi:hypothetical protein